IAAFGSALPDGSITLPETSAVFICASASKALASRSKVLRYCVGIWLISSSGARGTAALPRAAAISILHTQDVAFQMDPQRLLGGPSRRECRCPLVLRDLWNALSDTSLIGLEFLLTILRVNLEITANELAYIRRGNRKGSRELRHFFWLDDRIRRF